MPEGPEVEVIRQALEPAVVGQRIKKISVSNKPLRRTVAPKDFQLLRGQVVQKTQRKGKLLIFWTDDEQGFWCRLGMAGKLLIQTPKDRLRPHSHVVLQLENGTRLAYVDPRRFGEVVPFRAGVQVEQELSRLGPDPLLWKETARQTVAQALGKTKRQIKVALLDQSVLSGVGNIYACEALFLAQISPFRQSKSLTRAERNRLLRATETVLKRAVGLGGTSFSDYEQPDGSRGENFGHRHVFQRTNEPCRKCATPIGHKVQHGRSTFFCGRCQKCRG